jgi:hypothetical protein
MSFLNIRGNKNNHRYNGIRHSHDEIYKKFIYVSLATLVLLLYSFSIANVFAQTYPFIASTHNSFDLKTGKMNQWLDIHSALSILKRNDCPSQLAIYVHGARGTEQESKEQTDRAYLYFQKSGYHIPLVGFSWDSDTAFSIDDLNLSKSGWTVAKPIANQNGPLLARFIVDFEDKCQNDKLRSHINSIFVKSLNVEDARIYGKWLLSDVTGVDRSIKIYKPWTSDITFTEGMQGIEINQNGDFIMYGFDKSDIPTKTSGKYKLEGSVIKVNFEKGYLQPLNLKVISIDKDLLKIKVLDKNFH